VDHEGNGVSDWTLASLVRDTGAELLRWGPGPFRGVSTDSRRIAAGEVFVALVGTRHDGHAYVPTAVAAGATAVVASRSDVDLPEGSAWLQVGDTLESFGDLASAYRRALATRVVAVTGSNGKTTTKEMIASVLAASGASIAKNVGTENNLVGVPQTLLRLGGEERYAVVEMGMNHPGEIWRLTEIARPDVGVITNVGPAHLEGLGTLANVAAAKGELALAMPAGSTLVVNGSDPWLVPLAASFPGRTIQTGENGPVRAIAAEPLEGQAQLLSLEIDGRTVDARLGCVGAHNVANALLAAAVGTAFGMDAATIAEGLERFEPPPMRLELVRLANGACLWNDVYNANPASIEAALTALAAEPAKRRVVVVGEMWELGEEEAKYHREVGRRVAELGLDLLLAVGRLADEVAAGARDGGLPSERVERFDAPAAAAARLRAMLREGDVVLVKGSRGARMEEVVTRLRGSG